MLIPLGSSTSFRLLLKQFEDIKSEKIKMIFARVLCVVLLLYSASFGDSLSLKNDTHLEERTVINLPLPPHFEQNANDLVLRTKKMIVKPHAEDCRGFLLYTLREVWGVKPYNVLDVANTNSLVSNAKGLYFFFWSVYKDVGHADDIKKQSEIYPLYVGITGRTFRERFKEHINYDNGVVNKISTSKEWPTEGMKNLPLIVAYVLDIQLPVAKFYESVFLNSFNFAMNRAENEGRRPGIEVTTPQSVDKGYEHFIKGYEITMSYFNGLHDKVSKMNNEDKGKINYEFKY
ncbi:Hypothetical predicted protein [Paramuricea clavata]|uniref:Uncharacterized protein n=1 Tax=Paramuricea clavata TaxID=317549 RepID=A0A7D9LW58_PARCT|nr:Hypothetical predicted protein [Paramuricea clavata]